MWIVIFVLVSIIRFCISLFMQWFVCVLLIVLEPVPFTLEIIFKSVALCCSRCLSSDEINHTQAVSAFLHWEWSNPQLYLNWLVWMNPNCLDVFYLYICAYIYAFLCACTHTHKRMYLKPEPVLLLASFAEIFMRLLYQSSLNF